MGSRRDQKSGTALLPRRPDLLARREPINTVQVLVGFAPADVSYNPIGRANGLGDLRGPDALSGHNHGLLRLVLGHGGFRRLIETFCARGGSVRSFASEHVSRILASGSPSQMLGIDADRVVAGMQAIDRLRRLIASVSYHQTEPMRANEPPIEAIVSDNVAVPKRAFCADPRPALVFAFALNLAPKSLFKRGDYPSHINLRRYVPTLAHNETFA